MHPEMRPIRPLSLLLLLIAVGGTSEGAPGAPGELTPQRALTLVGAKGRNAGTPERVEEYHGHFNRIDLNRNGLLSHEEFVVKGDYLNERSRGGIFRASDSNQDGSVSREEYVLNRRITDEAKAIMGRADVDRDGQVSREEFLDSAIVSDKRLAPAIFKLLDADDNGFTFTPEYLRVWGAWARADPGPKEKPGPPAAANDWRPTPEMIDAARGSNPRFNVASRVLAPEYTGLSRAELGRAREQGIPVAELIQKNGRSVEEYLDRTLKIADAVLARNVAEGLMGADRAEVVRGFMRGNVRAMVYGRVDRTERHLAQPLSDFELPVPGLSAETDGLFTRGRAIFKRNWVEAPSNLSDRDGLGPLFNSVSCNACHFRDGRGRPEVGGGPGAGLLVKLAIPHGADGRAPEPRYGSQFHDRAIPGQAPEGRIQITYETLDGSYTDGEAYQLRRPDYWFDGLRWGELDRDLVVSPRVANQLVGMGRLEAVPRRALLALADPEDRDGDGISGRVSVVVNPATGKDAVGRFGWKAAATTVLHQTAAAFVNDMGITSSLFPVEPLTAGQDALRFLPHGGAPEISDADLRAVAAYTSLLRVPARRDRNEPAALRGEILFRELKCAACHAPSLPMENHPRFPELAATEIEPFTDLLLHDMGSALADSPYDDKNPGAEWRTPPLWGIGRIEAVNGHTFLLHDGRARNFSEAILWHGGEAEDSKEGFRSLPAAGRRDLIRFLKSL